MLRRLFLLAPVAIAASAFVLAGGGPWPSAVAGTPSGVAPCQTGSPSPVPVVSPTFGVQVVHDAPFYDPSLPTIHRGTTVVWTFVDEMEHHTVTDSSGLALYDSGTLDAGQSCDYTFTAAGNYDYVCTLHAFMTGRIHVPVWTAPHRGTRATTFTIVWSSAVPAAGYVFDVRVRKPGSTVWRQLRRGTVLRSGPFVPHGGVGAYRFEARMRDVATDHAVRWSEPATITVR
jgi:plastocyanin